MQMGVVESGHEKVSVQVHDLGLGPFEFHDVKRLAHSLDAIATNGESLFAKNRGELRVRGDAGIDVSVDVDHVGFRTCGSGTTVETRGLNLALRLGRSWRGARRRILGWLLGARLCRNLRVSGHRAKQQDCSGVKAGCPIFRVLCERWASAAG